MYEMLYSSFKNLPLLITVFDFYVKNFRQIVFVINWLPAAVVAKTKDRC